MISIAPYDKVKAYMAYDAHKNFAVSAVATAPSPASSGTSLVVTASDGTKFPTPPFNAIVCPANTQPTTANAEIVRVTTVSTDTFTIVRAQESSSARTITIGDQIAATITAKTLTDAELHIGSAVGSGTDSSILFVDSSGNLTQNNANLFYGAGGTLVDHFQSGSYSYLKGGIDVGDTAYFDTTVAMSIKSGRTWLFNMYGNTTNPIMFLGQNGHLSLKTTSSGTNATLTVNDPNTLDSLACAHISIDATGHKGLIIQGFGTGSIQEWQNASGVILSKVNSEGVFFPLQAATVSAPTYVKGGMYFDTTLNKLMIGGASGWETVTSS